MLERVGALFLDRGFDGAVHFLVGGSGGQIGLDDGDFLFFLCGEIGAAALGKLLGGIVALFDERLQHLKGFHIVERAHLFDFLEFQGGLHHAQDTQAEFVLFFHGGG